MTESTEGEANKMNIDGGKLVIVRYQKSKYIHNAATAYANAIQTPGVCVCARVITFSCAQIQII